MTLVCPVTSQVRNYPFEIVLVNKKVSGVIRVDQIRSIDWSARNVKYISKVSEEMMVEVTEMLASLILD
jgi:mRNA interferase MazF